MTSVVSLFSGAGGLDLGFVSAGCDIDWANDTDPCAKVMHDEVIRQAYFFAQQPKFTVGSIMDQDWDDIPDCDIIIGGPPCQAFSRAGLQDPDDPRRYMVFAFSAVVQFKQPRAFVMENVPAFFRNRKHTWIWNALRTQLEQFYDTELVVLDAFNYGVPQHRERMFLVGLPKGENLGPEFTAAILGMQHNGGTVRDAIGNMPIYGALGNDIGSKAKITFARNPVLRSSAYAGMLLNGARPLNLDAPSTTLPAIMGGNKTPVIDVKALEYGSQPWIEWYHECLVEQCIEPYGRNSEAEPELMRRITVQEAAALQTFPPDLPWDKVPMTVAYRLIGNAVPVRLATCVAKAVKYALDIHAGR